MDDGGEGIYFAVPYATAQSVMDTLIREGEVVRGCIGITVNPNFSEQQSLGIYVTGVERGSPAASAGLRRNDFIVSIGGQPVRSAPEGLDKVASTPPGEELEVEFCRRTKMATTVTVSELPR